VLLATTALITLAVCDEKNKTPTPIDEEPTTTTDSRKNESQQNGLLLCCCR
jgi:hypothetical protein